MNGIHDVKEGKFEAVAKSEYDQMKARLESEIKGLRGALEEILSKDDWCFYCGGTEAVASIARKALSGPDTDKQ